jgi:hypothetical protein
MELENLRDELFMTDSKNSEMITNRIFPVGKKGGNYKPISLRLPVNFQIMLWF